MAGDARRATRHPAAQEPQIQYEYDKAAYKQRNVIERMFARLKDWRSIATRFDRNIKNFIGAIALAAADMSPDPNRAPKKCLVWL